MLQRFFLSLIALAVNPILLAGSMGDVLQPKKCATLLDTPCDFPFWEFGAQALYFKPTYSENLGYVSTTNVLPLQKMDTDWNFGVSLSGRYAFHQGNDVIINWDHYDALSRPGTYTGQYALLGVGNIPATYGLTLTNRYDGANILLGQWVNVAPLKHLHVYGGAQYADLRVNMSNQYAISSQVSTFTGGSVSSVTNTEFQGFGPSIGGDFVYGVTPSVRVIANIEGALLYGTSRYHFGTNYGSGLVATSTYAATKTIVPEIDARLATSFLYYTMTGFFNVEVGYRAINYLSALYTQPTIGGIPANGDFGLYGPYFGVKWLG